VIVADITEFTIAGINERGKPNQEHIAIRANQTLNTGQYGVMLGHKPLGQTQAHPMRDSLFWFGDAILNEGDWIFLYTGPGNAFISDLPDGKKLYSTYWQKPHTVFAASETVPILFKVEAVQLGGQPLNVPHLTNA
jgi:hypothetical protein